MTTFTVRNGQFWLDYKPVLIQAGEFHYYRTPRDQWRHRLGLLQQAGFNTMATYIPWLWHQPKESIYDFDGHSHPMRDLSGFLDLASDMGLWIIPRPGPYIMAETINEGIPPWVFEKYPQIAFISQDNNIQNIVSYMHPDFLACVSQWYQAIFEVLTPRQITRGGKIIMVQLDNEMAMMPWVRRILDTNPDTMSRFAAYLMDAYRAQLPEAYPTDNLADFLREGILHPEEPSAENIVEDYRRFYRRYLRDYASFLSLEAKSNGLEVPPIINIHGFANGGKTFPIGISQLIDVIRMEGMLAATDVYPGIIGEGTFHQLLMVNEITKAIQNPEQPLFSMEFQSGGNPDFSNTQSSLYDLHTRLCISSGMRGINHYSFFGGENDPILSPVKRHDWGPPVRPDGTLRRHYHRYPKLSNVLKAYGADLILSQPKPVATIGLLLDYFMTEVNNRFTIEATSILTHQREVILFDMIGRGLALTHRAFNAVDLVTADLNVADIPVCWVMIERQCNANTQQKLVDYIRSGGNLILAGRMCTEDFYHRGCTILRDALGVTNIFGGSPFISTMIQVFHYPEVPASFVETYEGEFDEIFAADQDGEVVGFIKTIGKGKVLVFGASMEVVTLGDLDIVHQMALKMDCPSPFELSEWLDIRISVGANGSFLFINNYEDDPVETKIMYHGKPLLGGNPVHLPARTGQILPVDWQINKGILIHYITSEIVEIREDGKTIELKTQQDAFQAELTLDGYRYDGAVTIEGDRDNQRVAIQGTDGAIVLNEE